MNLRLYSIAILISALPQLAWAGSAISLTQQDFVAAERLTSQGETVIKVKLSKSGKAKFKRFKQHHLKQKVHAEIAGVKSDFVLREPIAGDDLQMGPYGSEDADRVVQQINSK